MEMADAQLNCQTDHEDGPEPQQKRRKRDGKEEEPVESEAESKSITNISSKLIDRIFTFLDLESLLRVAHTCKQLQNAAIAKYNDDFSQREVRLYPFESRRHSQASGIRLSPINFMQVFGLDFCFPFLRCFGAKMSHLNVLYNFNRVGTQTQRDHFDRYINQYCADSLTSIIFDCKPTFSNENFTEPFKNVTEMQIIGGKLGEQLPNFVNWFPNLSHLEIWFEITIDDNTTAVCLPNLKRLSIKVQSLLGYFTSQNVTKFLYANPQLQILTIYSDNSSTNTEFGKLLNMFSKNPCITKLKVGECLSYVNEDEANQLLLEHPLIEVLDLQDIAFSVDSALILIRKLESLTVFKFCVKRRGEYDRLVSQLDISKWTHNSMVGDDTLIILRKKNL